MSVNTIMDELEEIQKKLDRLLAAKSQTGIYHVESETADTKDWVGETKKVFVKEELDMDFKEVLVFNQTEKALLVVKKGHQQWLARQFIKDPLELGYQNGNTYDLELKEKSPTSDKPLGWVTKKWEKFEVFKG